MDVVTEELTYLRKKVNKLEAMIDFIQNDLKYKIASVLERFFDQRASHLAKQRKAIQIEEDFCLDLLSCCADLPDADLNVTSSGAGVAPKRKRTELDTDEGKKKRMMPLPKPRSKYFQRISRKEEENVNDNESNSTNDFEGGDSDGDDNDTVPPYQPSFAGQRNSTVSTKEDDIPDDIAIKSEVVEMENSNSDNDEEMADEPETSTTNRTNNASRIYASGGGVKSPTVSNTGTERIKHVNTIGKHKVGRDLDQIWQFFDHEKQEKSAKCRKCKKLVCARAYLLKAHKKLCDNVIEPSRS